MKCSVFVFMLLSVALAPVSSQKDSSGNDKSTETEKGKYKTKTTKNSESKEEDTSEPQTNRQKQHFFIVPDNRLIFDPRLQNGPFSVVRDDGTRYPQLALSQQENPKQGFYLSDDSRRYNLQVENFQHQKPSGFSTALGAISAHILNQGAAQEYIPYPPNGDPYNYPAYRGYPHATEPPIVRTYETASNANYGVQSAENFGQVGPRKAFSNNDYRQNFPNQFDNFGLGFYTNPYIFNGGGFYSGLRRSGEPIYDERFRQQNQDAEEFRRPIK